MSYSWTMARGSLSAQVVVGTLVDERSGDPVSGALVAHERGEQVIGSAVTGIEGRFELRLRGDPPFELTIQRMGYETVTTKIDELEPDERRELTVTLPFRPVMLEGVEVGSSSSERERWIGEYLITDHGAFVYGDRSRCAVIIILQGDTYEVIRDGREIATFLDRNGRVDAQRGRAGFGKWVFTAGRFVRLIGGRMWFRPEWREASWPCRDVQVYER